MDDRELRQALLYCTGHLWLLLEHSMRAAGIRRSAFSVLVTLEMHGHLTQAQLAQTERVTPATMSALIRDLAEQGLVARTPDANDRRVVNISLTRAGEDELARRGEHLRASFTPVVAQLEATDKTTLEAGLRVLMRAIDTEVRPQILEHASGTQTDKPRARSRATD